MKEVKMFKHILLPTDGSHLSEAAIHRGVQFAKSINAKITGISVMPERKFYLYQTGVIVRSKEQALREHKPEIDRRLSVIRKAATDAEVPCETLFEVSDYPYEAIIGAAEQERCDLIMMASHGRKGVGAILLGSETHKVLTYSKIPVLVFR